MIICLQCNVFLFRIDLSCHKMYFVLVWLYKYFDMSVTDESYVDEHASGVLNYNPGTFDN